MADSTAARDRAIEDLARRIELEGEMTTRPGQLAALRQVAREVRALAGVPAPDVAAPEEDSEESYRMVADHVIKWLNPRDGDEAEEALVMDSIKRAAQFIEAQPCTCEEGAADFDVDPCERCAALGRRADQEVEW